MGNQIRINFLPCEPTPAEGYLVKYRPVGSMGAFRVWPDNFADTPAVFVTDEDADGTQYEGEIYGDCGDGNLGVAIPWSTDESSSGSEGCTPVAFVESSVPDATDGEAYSVDLHLTGTGPFALESVTKPAWMTVTLVGAVVELRGTPPSAGTDEELTVVASNCGGGDTDTFSATFDVVEPTPGLGTVSADACVALGSVQNVVFNDNPVTPTGPGFPVGANESIEVDPGEAGTHHLSVLVDGGGTPGRVVVTDSLGNVQCLEFLGGAQTLDFLTDFTITGDVWSVVMECGTCP